MTDPIQANETEAKSNSESQTANPEDAEEKPDTEEVEDEKEGEEDEEKKEQVAPVRRNYSRPRYEKSQITESTQYPRLSDPSKPLTIIFLDGAFAGQELDLGTNIQKLSESQSASWEATSGRGGRVAANFNNISARTFSLELDYWDDKFDISQMIENVAHLQEITDFSANPPLLQFKVGRRTIEPVVCTSYDPEYDTPIVGDVGFHHGVVRLSFLLLGGEQSKHFLATPLGSTPLGDYRERTSQLERQRQAQLSALKNVLAQCLDEKGEEQLQELIDNNKLDDPEALAALDDRTLFQVAAAGMDKTLLENEQLRDRVQQSVASSLARDEDGLSPADFAALERALQTGDTSGLRPSLTEQQTISVNGQTQTTSVYDTLATDYSLISDAVLNQNLGSDSEVFDRTKHPTAHQRLTSSAGCGLQMRSLGFGNIFGGGVGGSSEQATIDSINNLLANSNITDDQLRDLFSLPEDTPETVIRKLRNGGPYSSKQEFMNNLNYNRQGVTSNSMWTSYQRNESSSLGKLSALIASAKPGEDGGEADYSKIKEALGVNDEIAAKIVEKGTFANRQEFIQLVGQGGAEAWVKLLSLSE